MTTSTRPAAGTRAGAVHALVHQLRAAADDPDSPARVLRIARGLDHETARAALAISVLSERWSDDDRQAMGAPPPEPIDHDAIRDENTVLRAQAGHPRRRRTSPVAEPFDVRLH